MVDNIEKDTISLTPRDSEGDIEISRETKYFIFNQEPEQEQNDTYDEYIEKQIDKMKSEMMTLLTDKINILTERYDLLKTTIKSHILKKVANITEVFGLDKINADELKNGNSFVQNYASKNICKHLDDIFALHEQISKAIHDNIDILDSFLQIEKYLDKEEPIQEFLSSNLGTIYNSWLFLHLNFEKNNINDMFASQKIPNDVKVFIEKNSDNKFSEMKIIETDTDQIRKYMELLNNNKDKLTKLKMQSAQFVGDYFAGQEYTFPKLSKLTFRRTAIERIPFNLFPACTKLSFERIPKFDFSILHLINPLKLQKIAFEKSNLITSEFNTIISTLFQSKQITNNLTHLSFANNFITNVDFTILYNLKLNKLKEIDFHNNRITKFIIDPNSVQNLKMINLCNNCLSKPSMTSLKKNKTIIFTNNNIYLTNQTNNDLYYETLKNQLSEFDYGIKTLNLSGMFNVFNRSKLLDIKINSSIQISVKKLDLSYCSLDCETLFKFFTINPGFLELRSLDINGNLLSDDFFSLYLKNKLHTYFTKLSHLYISANEIKGTDFRSIAEFIKENKCLTRIIITKNPFSNAYTSNKEVDEPIEEFKDTEQVTDFCSLIKMVKFLNSDKGIMFRNYNKKETGFYMKYDLYKKYNCDNEKNIKSVIQKIQ